MKRGYSIFFAASTAICLVTIGSPVLAQGPSQAQFETALRPVPKALQGGHQGLPTFGSPAPAPREDPNVQRASISSAPAAAPAAAPAGNKTNRRAAQPHQAATHQATAWSLPVGCPAQSDNSGKPMIGFKIAFEFGSAQLKPEAVDTLRKLGKALNAGLGDQKLFEIEGHTDAVGTLAFNEELSQARAEAVKEFLVREMNVATDRLKVVGKAFCEPADPAHPNAAENRRVVVINQTS